MGREVCLNSSFHIRAVLGRSNECRVAIGRAADRCESQLGCSRPRLLVGAVLRASPTSRAHRRPLRLPGRPIHPWAEQGRQPVRLARRMSAAGVLRRWPHVARLLTHPQSWLPRYTFCEKFLWTQRRCGCARSGDASTGAEGARGASRACWRHRTRAGDAEADGHGRYEVGHDAGGGATFAGDECVVADVGRAGAEDAEDEDREQDHAMSWGARAPAMHSVSGSSTVEVQS